jgi:hypothetical protein
MPDKCSARRTDGSPCKAWPRKGQAVCRTHGGSSPQALRKAAERQELAKAEKEHRKVLDKWSPAAATAASVDVLDELLKTVAMVTSWRDFLSDRLGQLQADAYRYPTSHAGEQLRADVALFERSLDRTSRLLIDCSKLDLAARKQEADERQARNVLAILAIALKTLGLDDKDSEVFAAVSGALDELAADEARRSARQGPRVSPVRR